MADDKTNKSDEIISQNLFTQININPNLPQQEKYQKNPHPSEREIMMRDRSNSKKPRDYHQMLQEFDQANRKMDQEMASMKRKMDSDMSKMRSQMELDMENFNLFSGADDDSEPYNDMFNFDLDIFDREDDEFDKDEYETFTTIDTTRSIKIQHNTQGETVTIKEKAQADTSLSKNDAHGTENSDSLDSASKKLNELQSAVDSLIGQKVTPDNAKDYVNQYNSVEKNISSFLESLVPLVEDNQKRKLKRDEAEKLSNMWDKNMEKCQEKITKYESDYKDLSKEIENSKENDDVALSKLENLKYVLDEWKTLSKVASTHTTRTGKDVEKLNTDMHKINKISYQISSFNLRLRTLVVTSESYISSDELNSKDLSSIQQALNVSLEKIKNLEKEQLSIMS